MSKIFAAFAALALTFSLATSNAYADDHELNIAKVNDKAADAAFGKANSLNEKLINGQKKLDEIKANVAKPITNLGKTTFLVYKYELGCETDLFPRQTWLFHQITVQSKLQNRTSLSGKKKQCSIHFLVTTFTPVGDRYSRLPGMNPYSTDHCAAN